MKHWMLAAALICFGVEAQATPYFRLLDPKHPQPVVGALLAPEDLGQTGAASMLPLITHSPTDGCFLPSLVCEDWTPLSVGASANSGNFTFDVAPLANVLPWMQTAALAVTPSSWQGIQRILSSSLDRSVTFSAGPVWEYQQAKNKGFFRVFTGLSLHF